MDVVQVAIRVRPVPPACRTCVEVVDDGRDKPIVRMIPPAETRAIRTPSRCITPGRTPATPLRPQTFAFDSIFDERSSQAEIFDSCVAPLVDAAIAGYHSSVFAYGSTGSGKTHTMLGEEGDQRGIIPRAVARIFDSIDSRVAVLLTYAELYSNEFRDLLDANNDSCKEPNWKPSKIELRDNGHQTYLTGTATVRMHVSTLQEAMECIAAGDAHRTFGSTEANNRSSRSHCILTLEIQRDHPDGSNQGKISLVDLAGSERLATKKIDETNVATQAETLNINTSLSALGNCMNALAKRSNGDEQATRVPFRDNKLTFLLKDSLGGSARTLMIVTIHPAVDYYRSTLQSLKYASSAKRIKVAAKLEFNDSHTIDSEQFRILYQQNEALRAMLSVRQEEIEQLQKVLEATQQKLQVEASDHATLNEDVASVRDAHSYEASCKIMLQAKVEQVHSEIAYYTFMQDLAMLETKAALKDEFISREENKVLNRDNAILRNALRNALSEHALSVDEAGKDIALLQDELNRSIKRCSELRDVVEQIQKVEIESREKMKHRDIEIEQMRSSISTLLARVNESDSQSDELKRANAQVAKLKGALSGANNNLKTLRDRVRQLEEHEAQIWQSNSQHQAEVKDLKETKKLLAKHQEDAKALRSELKRKDTVIKKLERELNELRSSIKTDIREDITAIDDAVVQIEAVASRRRMRAAAEKENILTLESSANESSRSKGITTPKKKRARTRQTKVPCTRISNERPQQAVDSNVMAELIESDVSKLVQNPPQKRRLFRAEGTSLFDASPPKATSDHFRTFMADAGLTIPVLSINQGRKLSVPPL